MAMPAPAPGTPGVNAEPGPGFSAGTGFGALALRLWGPLLTREQGSW